MKKIPFQTCVAALLCLACLQASAEKAEKPHYELDFKGTTGTVEAGKDGVIVVAIRATDGYKINKDYPFKTSVPEVKGLEFPKMKFTKADIKDISKPVLEIPFKAVEKGMYEVRVSLNFSVCTPDICEMRKPVIPVKIEVR